jgi:hypothetical protein
MYEKFSGIYAGYSGKVFDRKNILPIFAPHFEVVCAVNCGVKP